MTAREDLVIKTKHNLIRYVQNVFIAYLLIKLMLLYVLKIDFSLFSTEMIVCWLLMPLLFHINKVVGYAFLLLGVIFNWFEK